MSISCCEPLNERGGTSCHAGKDQGAHGVLSTGGAPGAAEGQWWSELDLTLNTHGPVRSLVSLNTQPAGLGALLDRRTGTARVAGVGFCTSARDVAAVGRSGTGS